jgi:ribosomal protein L16/L10AE
MLFEMEGVTREIAEKAFTLALHKLPLKTRIISRAELIL